MLSLGKSFGSLLDMIEFMFMTVHMSEHVKNVYTEKNILDQRIGDLDI